MALDRAGRTEINFWGDSPTPNAASGTGNFNLGGLNSYGNVPINLTEQTGDGWAGCEDAPSGNVRVSVYATQYYISSQNGYGNGVLTAH